MFASLKDFSGLASRTNGGTARLQFGQDTDRWHGSAAVTPALPDRLRYWHALALRQRDAAGLPLRRRDDRPGLVGRLRRRRDVRVPGARRAQLSARARDE